MSKDSKKSEPKPPQVAVYFDARDAGYWYQIKSRFLKLGSRDLKMHLRTLGLGEMNFFQGLREIDYPLYDAQMNRVVDYAGALAGHRVGVSKSPSGNVILVTQETPDIFAEYKAKKPKAPKWIKSFVEELLPGDQADYFFHWLKIALV